jgi:membrane protease YdiL (CAAX protease family)
MIDLLRRPFPSLPVAVALGILVQLLGAALVWGVVEVAPGVPGADLVAVALAHLVVLTLGIRASGRPMREVLALRRVSGRVLSGTVVAAVGWAILIGSVSNLVKTVYPMPEMEGIRLRTVFGASLGVLTVVRLVGLAPMTEELLVRGLFLHGLRARHGDRWGVFLAAGLFAALHGSVWLAVPAFVGGLVFGSWVVATGSIVPALLGHAISNGIAVVRLYGLPGVDAFEPHSVAAITWFPLPVQALAVVLALGGGWLIHGRRSIPDADERV